MITILAEGEPRHLGEWAELGAGLAIPDLLSRQMRRLIRPRLNRRRAGIQSAQPKRNLFTIELHCPTDSSAFVLLSALVHRPDNSAVSIFGTR